MNEINVKSSKLHPVLNRHSFLISLFLLHYQFLLRIELIKYLLILIFSLRVRILIESEHLLYHLDFGFGVDCF